MIFYHPDCDLKFSLYGIEIPIVDNRAKRVFDHLQHLDSTFFYTDLDKVEPISTEDLIAVHDKGFIERLFGTHEQLEQEMLSCYELIDSNGQYHRYNPNNARENFTHARDIILKQVSMTYASTQSALQTGFSYYLGGGMHHAMSFGGRGFCLVNDIVITLKKLQRENVIKSAWVVDVDAHKGDGTAELTVNDSHIKTLSLHMGKSWPLNMGTGSEPWFLPSSIDIAFNPNEEGQYLTKLEESLKLMELKFGIPDLVVVVDGADPFEADELESSSDLKLSKQQMLERDLNIYRFFKARNIPQSYLMAGGYGKRSWEIYAQFLEFVWKDSSKGTKVSAR